MGLERAGDQGRESPMNIHVHAPAVFMARECWGNETLHTSFTEDALGWISPSVNRRRSLVYESVFAQG